MRLSTGRWVSGDDFFDRDRELRVLEQRVREGNHVLLTGQRRMGKTSVLQELGRRLETDGWIFLFADLEGAACAEDAVADIAQAIHPVRPIASRLASTMRRWLTGNVEEISAYEFRIKVRAGLDGGSWKHHGEQLLRDCATQDEPVLLVIDELPIFLTRVLRDPNGERGVDEFLSWLRAALQNNGGDSLTVIVSGSIGLTPLVQRLGVSDRINYFYPFRLGPWSRDDSIACFERLAANCGMTFEDGVANAVYERLGIGVPHHVQSFFARLRDFAMMHGQDRVTMEDVDNVYFNELLGPSGQSDLIHYETRLKAGLDRESYTIAMEILAEAATEDQFSPEARRALEQLYSPLLSDAQGCVADTIDVLVHDGYLEEHDGGHRFPSLLMKDWWSARFRNHHVPLTRRRSARESRQGAK